MLSTSKKERAMQLLGLPAKEIREFVDEPDLYNTGNTLTGFISRRMDHRYGALVLTHINKHELPREQVIYGTPKMHYPFDKLGKWTWPKVKKLRVYTKLDGTNVVAYRYYCYANKKYYTTYKSRLTPILKDGRFGSFQSMWKELEAQYDIRQYVIDTGIHLSFEMYGSRNLHMIKYNTPLNTKLLFGVDQSIGLPEVVDPSDLQLSNYNLPSYPDKQELKSGSDVNTFYTKLQEEQEAMNQGVEMGNGQVIEGEEGFIFYVHDENNKVIQFKCKAPSIQEIHWAAGGLNNQLIRSACFKAFENFESPTPNDVKRILVEDHDHIQVEAHHYKIEDIFESVEKELIIRQRIIEFYQKAKEETGTTIEKDKATIMRYLSKHFNKSDMGYVYFIINSTIQEN